MYTVTFNNTSGELESAKAATPEEAAVAAIKMIESAGVLYNGDNITIKGEDGDE